MEYAAHPHGRLTPCAGWSNDPNGLIYWNGEYHAFYQHNPHDTVWGPMHWGHAVSEDLVHWRHLPIALYPHEKGTAFSGTAVCDQDNTAGFGAGAMVLIYTLDGEAQTQGIAHSTDGITFTPYEGNPVIHNPGIADFRDPKVFWYDEERMWKMVLSAQDRAHFYESPNLKDWTKTGEFGPQGNFAPGVWECPDLFPLPAPSGEEKWVLLVSMGMAPEQGGARTQVFVGGYDGKAFVKTQRDEAPVWLDEGSDNYATSSFSGLERHRRMLVGWMANAAYAGKVPTVGYRGQMTLPRLVTLTDTPYGLRLQKALPEQVLSQFAQPRAYADKEGLPQSALVRFVLNPGQSASLLGPSGDVLAVSVGMDGSITADRSRSGPVDFDPLFPKPCTAKRLREGACDMLLYVDIGGIELYADGGDAVFSMLAYPRGYFTRIEAPGEVLVSPLKP